MKRAGKTETPALGPRRHRLASAGIVVASALLLLAAAAPERRADEALLKLQVGRFDPAQGLPRQFAEAVPDAAGLASAVPRGQLHVVQFHDGPGSSEQARLGALGVRVLDYLPEHALIVRVPVAASAETLLASVPGVRAVVPYAWALRLSPRLRELGAATPDELRITAYLADDADADALADLVAPALAGVSATVVRRDPPARVQLAGPRSALATAAHALAQHADVLFVGLDSPNELHNDRAVWIGQSYDRVNGPAEGTAPDPKPYSLSGTIFEHGITGTGQVIGIADTRLEHQMDFFHDPVHPVIKQRIDPPGALAVDPEHRKILAYNTAIENAELPPYPTWRHGTHTSGSATGDALANLSTPQVAGHDTGDGMAPNAKLVYLDMYLGLASNCTDLICALCNVANILQQEYDAGARISTNSWGNEGDGGPQADAWVWDHPDHLVIFSAGNDGVSGLPVKGTAAAKNVLGVGASESYDPSFNDVFGILDPENLVAFSSGGPATDGRIKPDIIAPGFQTRSAGFLPTYHSDVSDPACDPQDVDVCFPSFGGCYTVDSSQTDQTVVLSGTSMAAPTVAGLAALARQYFTDGFYPSGAAVPADVRNPSAALLKAVLLNGARNMTGRRLRFQGTASNRADLGPLEDAPSNRQGWGRILLDDALYFAGDSRRLLAHDVPSSPGSGLGTGDATIHAIDVDSTSTPLEVTLVWTDPPAAAAAALALRSDLDLVVTAPDGRVYRGNQWAAEDINVPDDKQSAPDPAGRDTLNNVEGILLRTPQLGSYRIEVRGANVPGYQGLFTQGYAIVVSGELNDAGEYCGTPAPPPQEFAASALAWNDVLLTWQAVPGASSYEIWRSTTACAPQAAPERVFVAPGAATSYHDRTTDLATTYHYTVRARVDPAGCGTGSSACATVTTPPPPTVLLVSPDSGANNDPVTLTISGANFRAVPRVFLETDLQPHAFELHDVTFVSPTELRAVVPVSLPPEAYDLRVRNPDGAAHVLDAAYSTTRPLQFDAMYLLDRWHLTSNVVQVHLDDFQSVAGVPTAANGSNTSNIMVALASAQTGVFIHEWTVAGKNVGVFNPTSLVVKKRLAAPGSPRFVDVTPDGKRAYILCNANPTGVIAVLDLETNAFIDTIPLGTPTATGALIVSPDGQRVYAHTSELFDYPPVDVVAIDTSTHEIVGSVLVGSLPRRMALSSDSSRLYVPITFDQVVKVIDTATLAVVDTIDLSQPGCTSAPCQRKPNALALSPDDSTLYAAAEIGAVKVDLGTNQVTAFTPGNYFEMVYDRKRDKLYSTANAVYIRRLDAATLADEGVVDEVPFNIERPNGLDLLEAAEFDVVGVAPVSGCSTGGTQVDVTGSAFQDEVRDASGAVVQPGTRVLFGGVEAFSVSLIDSGTLRVLAPPRHPGLVDVEVIHPSGQSETLAGAFTYVSPCLALPAVPPVPDGSFGHGMTAARLDASGSAILLNWDTDTCPAPEYHVVHGDLATVHRYEPAGAECFLGLAGHYFWTGIPPGDLWFLIVGNNGAGTEGSWGTGAAGNVRPGQTPDGVCFVTRRVDSDACP